MTKVVAGWLAVMLIGAPLLGQNLCEYQAPETYLQDLKISFYYRHFDAPDGPGPEVSSGRLFSSYYLLQDSPTFGLSFTGSGEVNLQGLQVGGIAGEASGTLRRYFQEEAPYFAFGGLEASWASGFALPGVEVRGGLGYGHFTDVTPLAKAYRIEAKLLEQGAIAAALSNEALLAVAREIGRRAEFPGLADLVAAVEEIIEAETHATLDARALLTIEEIIEEEGWSRYCGYALQLGVGYQLLDPEGQERDFLVTMSAEGALAPEPGSQLLVRASFSGPIPITEQYTLTLTASYDYRLNETTTFVAQYSLRQVKPAGQVPAGDQSALFRLNFDFGGADFSLQVTFSKVAEDPTWTQDLIMSVGMDIL
jgi:hypothetical protein